MELWHALVWCHHDEGLRGQGLGATVARSSNDYVALASIFASQGTRIALLPRVYAHLELRTS